MQRHGMAHGHVIAEDERPFVAHDVEHSAVLDVGARADADVVHIAANHGARPDARILPNHDIADNHSGGVDISRFRDLWPLAAVGPDVGLASQSCPSLRSADAPATHGQSYLI